MQPSPAIKQFARQVSPRRPRQNKTRAERPKKGRPARGSILSVVALELKLQRELQLPRRPGISRREARAGDRREGLQPGRRGWQDHYARATGRPRLPEIRMVEEVERIDTELEIESLRDLRVFDQRQIHVRKSRTGEGVASEIAEAVGGRYPKRRRCVGDPLRGISADHHRSQKIGPNRVKSPCCERSAQHNRKGVSRLRADDRRDLPSADQTVSLEG